MTAYPLMLTVEHEPSAMPDRDGWAVIKLNGREVARIRLRYSSDVGDRDALEQHAADWLASLGEEIRQLREDVAQLEIRESEK